MDADLCVPILIRADDYRNLSEKFETYIFAKEIGEWCYAYVWNFGHLKWFDQLKFHDTSRYTLYLSAGGNLKIQMIASYIISYVKIR